MRQSGTGCAFIDYECSERGLVFIPEVGECRPVLRPGSPGCSHSLQCSQAFPEARCIQQICTCPSHLPSAVDGTCAERCAVGQVYSGVAGQCLPTVSPAGQCLYTSQCQAIEQGMTCENSVCRCPNGLVFSGSHCTPSCPISYVVDSRGVCIPGCQGNQIEVDGECLSHAVAGEPCRVHAQCTGGASCLKGRCVCPQDMISNGSVCVYGTTRSLFPG
ncbi:EB module [Ancylostoma caninum]|uniref:EB module n=1 Tax=Ancylostoma caninum TaxID=29170 RepID=A0A368H9R9_ANCCA|nr:EB module [Ancylostoma caninum]